MVVITFCNQALHIYCTHTILICILKRVVVYAREHYLTLTFFHLDSGLLTLKMHHSWLKKKQYVQSHIFKIHFCKFLYSDFDILYLFIFSHIKLLFFKLGYMLLTSHIIHNNCLFSFTSFASLIYCICYIVLYWPLIDQPDTMIY